MKRQFLLVPIVALISAMLVLAQNEDSEVSEFSDVPKGVIRDVVHRVLIYKFKPVSKKKRIILANQIYFTEPGSSKFEITIDQSWLPKIRNIEFQLQSSPFDKDVYFFKEWESKSSVFWILFAYGDPKCSYLGDLWAFRTAGARSRLWPDGGAGGGCSGSSSPAIFKRNDS